MGLVGRRRRVVGAGQHLQRHRNRGVAGLSKPGWCHGSRSPAGPATVILGGTWT